MGKKRQGEHLAPADAIIVLGCPTYERNVISTTFSACLQARAHHSGGLYSRTIMQAQVWRTAILVTEPNHIKRATLIARDAGLTVYPSPLQIARLEHTQCTPPEPARRCTCPDDIPASPLPPRATMMPPALSLTTFTFHN